jgi:hypothetical protein
MSQISKLGYVDSKLGAPSSGQQTTRILFNTIEAPGTTSSLTFFKTFQGLTQGQTNLTQNKLDSMESMVIKTIWLSQFPTTGQAVNFGGLVQQTLSIIVGNQTVVKNLPIQFNQGVNGQAYDRLHENAGALATLALLPTDVNSVIQIVQPMEIRLLTDIVIPPQVAFEVRIDSNAGVYGTGAVVCALSGYGKIFSAGNTF